MYRIDNSTALATIPAPRAVGPVANGFFTNGNFSEQIPATDVDDDWLNAVQEELIAVLVAAGLTPSKTNRAQVIAAIEFLIAAETTRAEAAELAIEQNHAYYPLTSSAAITIPAGVYYARGSLTGAGGGGGGSANPNSAGAGGGGTHKITFGLSVVPGDVLTYTIPSGGTGGNTTPTSGTSGGTAYLYKNGVQVLAITGGGGGGYGNGAASSAPGSPGTFSVASGFGIQVRIDQGSAGGNGFQVTTEGLVFGGFGGNGGGGSITGQGVGTTTFGGAGPTSFGTGGGGGGWGGGGSNGFQGIGELWW